MKKFLLGIACSLCIMLAACNEDKESPSSNSPTTKDIDSVLKTTANLHTTGKTLLCGPNCKDENNCSENPYDSLATSQDCSDGDCFADSSGYGGRVSLKAKGYAQSPSISEVEMSGDKVRSKADILRVVRQRTPGLRHIYRRFMKNKPNFAGRVKVNFTIASDGSVSSATIVSSTTGYAGFDNDIKNAVSRWRFNQVESGTTTVTIPFTFSELPQTK